METVGTTTGQIEFVCTTSDVEQYAADDPVERALEMVASDLTSALKPLVRNKGIRTRIIESYEILRSMYEFDAKAQNFVRYVPVQFMYQCVHPSRKRRQTVDVDNMVEKWAQTIPRLSLAHDRDELDKEEAKIDELLTPILAAPVQQLREFFSKLVTRLKADTSVPFVIWRTYEVWHDKVIKPADDEAIKRLKRDLAEEIVTMVDPAMPDIQADIRQAMINALMWRDTERLEEVKEAIVEGQKRGTRPRVKGRESCLFLTVEQEGKEAVEVML